MGVNLRMRWVSAEPLLEFTMPKTVMQTVLQQLKHEQARLRKELNGVSAALTAFGRAYMSGVKPVKPAKRRTISAAGRKRIAGAQRARWAKVKASQKKSSKR